MLFQGMRKEATKHVAEEAEADKYGKCNFFLRNESISVALEDLLLPTLNENFFFFFFVLTYGHRSLEAGPKMEHPE